MMKNETLNALILRHGDRMLRQSGWPDAIDMAPVAPGTVPGWLAACGSLSGTQILTLTEQLCQPLTYGRAALLLASARRLAGAYFHERRSLNNFHRDRVITFEQIAE